MIESVVQSIVHARVDERQSTVIADLIAEFERQNLVAEHISIDRFLAEHPEYAAELRECLEGLMLLQESTKAWCSSMLVRGSRLGNFEIEQEIGRGAMGIVYRARELPLDRVVAIKILNPAFDHDRMRTERFRREALAASSLDHPNIVPIYHIGNDQGLNYFAMRLVDGDALHHDLLKKDDGTGTCSRSRKLRELARQLSDIAQALGVAHQHGIVHRDIKPSNLLIDRDGRLWLSDFGLAKQLSAGDLTQSGELVGSLHYMSPEQARGCCTLDGRSDIYSLGATMYELFLGQPVHAGFDGLELLRRVESNSGISMRRAAAIIPGDLRTIIERCLRPDPVDRFSDCFQLSDDLRRFASSQPIHCQPVTAVERFTLWSRRHATKLAAGLCAALVIVSAIGFHNLTLRRLNHQAEQVARLAESHFRAARETVDTLGVKVAAQLREVPGAEAIRAELLTDTLAYYEGFIQDANHSHELVTEVAATRLELARLYALDDRAELAMQQYSRMLQALQDSDEPSGLLVRAQAANELSVLQLRELDPRSAVATLSPILHRLRGNSALPIATSGEAAPSVRSRVLALALTANNLAIAHLQLDEPEAARTLLHEASTLLASNVPLAEDYHDDWQWTSQLAAATVNLATLLDEQGSYTASIKLLNQAIAWQSSQVPTRAGQTKGKRQTNGKLWVDAKHGQQLALMHSNLASVYKHSGRFDSAIDEFQLALSRLDQAIVDCGESVLSMHRKAVIQNNLAMLLCQTDQLQAAEKHFQDGASLLTELLAETPDRRDLQRSAAGLFHNYAILLRDTGRLAEAEDYQQRASNIDRDAVTSP